MSISRAICCRSNLPRQRRYCNRVTHRDVTDSAFCNRLVEATVGRFDRLDIVVNSAGVYRRGTTAAMPGTMKPSRKEKAPPERGQLRVHRRPSRNRARLTGQPL